MKRNSLIRIIRLTEEIKKSPYQKISYLATLFEVSSRTIKRDIATLKTEYDAPIQYNYEKKGYYFTTNWTFSLPDLTEGEVLTLLLATTIMKQFSGTSLGSSLKSVENKIFSLFQDKITLSSNDLSLLISAQASSILMKKDVQDIFDCLLKAISKKKTVTIQYYSLSSNHVTTRNVDPYHLYHYQGVWYFCGYCHNRKEVRDFALDRIHQCILTDVAFTIQESFQPNQYLKQAFRMVKGKTEKIKILFDAYQARWIRERVWHSSQTIEELKNGALLLTLEADPNEIKQWVLSYGAHTEIIEPDHLRNEIQQELSETYKKYAK